MDRTPKQKMLAGDLYDPDDPELHTDNRTARAWMARYNAAATETPAPTDPAATDPAGTPAPTETPALDGVIGQDASQQSCVVPFGS